MPRAKRPTKRRTPSPHDTRGRRRRVTQEVPAVEAEQIPQPDIAVLTPPAPSSEERLNNLTQQVQLLSQSLAAIQQQNTPNPTGGTQPQQPTTPIIATISSPSQTAPLAPLDRGIPTQDTIIQRAITALDSGICGRSTAPSNSRNDPSLPASLMTGIQELLQASLANSSWKAYLGHIKRVRDYTKYFKPVLCYLEGTWTNTDDNVDESFPSDRHHIDAKTWSELQEKIRFNAYSGHKDGNENYAFLPSMLMGMQDGVPKFAQWNYRIVCHPIKMEVPLDRFKVIDDLGYRTAIKHSPEHFALSRAARFRLNASPYARVNIGWKDFHCIDTFIDQMMMEIPGLNNYGADLTDDAYGETANKIGRRGHGRLNAAYYHNYYRIYKNDAMGSQIRKRGFADANIYMAMNTQEKVTAMNVTNCVPINPRENVCTRYSQKWSYAIPLEIIYLTPLQKWNPYNLQHKGDPSSEEGQTVTANNRNGEDSTDSAYDGTHDKLFYITPAAFTLGDEVGADPADTATGVSYHLDPQGEVRKMIASGIRTMLPYIPGVGALRQRYPIMPIHSEGNTVYKELEALKDIVLRPNYYHFMSREDGSDNEEEIFLKLSPSTIDQHEHSVTITKAQLAFIKIRSYRYLDNVYTTDANAHTHRLRLKYRAATADKAAAVYIDECDVHRQKLCWDGHGEDLLGDLNA